MAKAPPTREERDANLDALTSAVKEWGDKETARLENEVKFMRAVLKGRIGSEKAGTANLDSLSKLLQAEVDAFMGQGGDSNRS
jgi:hypothetical protein